MNLEDSTSKISKILNKKSIERVGYVSALVLLMLSVNRYEDPVDDELLIPTTPIITLDSTFVEIEKPIQPEKKDLYDFLDDLAFKESSNRYHVQNQFGYMGKYQFGQSTLRGLGYNISRNEFINSPELQEQAMIDLLIHNRDYLITYIDRWVGKTKNGIEITESGILAAAHLGGQRNVRNYFRYDIDFKDGNGTPLSYYMEKFGGYELGFEDMKTDYIAEIPSKMVTLHEKRLQSR